jgi:hypothetical protein
VKNVLLGVELLYGEGLLNIILWALLRSSLIRSIQIIKTYKFIKTNVIGEVSLITIDLNPFILVFM